MQTNFNDNCTQVKKKLTTKEEASGLYKQMENEITRRTLLEY